MSDERVSDKARTAFEATIANLDLGTHPSIALDETVVPDELASWASFRGSGRLPTISVRRPGVEPARNESSTEAELELLDLLGEGGMGQVFRATQRSLGREVAVKTLRPGASQRAVASLYDEAVVTGRLSHPNVIPVHALGNAADGVPLLVMKRVEGVAWSVLLHSPDHGFWSRMEIAAEDRQHFHVEVLRKVTYAIAFAHSHGVIHRDIKPENVMIGDFGEVYLVDWGIAVRAGTNTEGKLAGTPQYMAPEMLGGIVDARTDVYLLGATLCEILTGVPPHRGAVLKEVLQDAFVSAAPTFAGDVPGELETLCTSALSRDPTARPASAHAFGDALDDYVRHRGSRALARTGEQRVAELRSSIENVPPAQRDLAALRRLVAESRFAFHEARRGWADNPDVPAGLRAVLELAVRIELDRRDIEAARAMLSEIDEPSPELVQAVATLSTEHARDAAERARLERLARDLDPEIEGGTRIAVAAVVLAMIVAIGIYAMTVDALTPTHPFVIAAVMCSGMLALLLVLWRRITRTGFNRRLSAWVAVGGTMLLAHRGLALFDPAATVASILTTDLVILGGFWAFGSIFLFRWMFAIGIGLALCAIPSLAMPSATPMLFAAANAVAIAAFIAGWQLRRKPTSGGPPARRHEHVDA